MDRLIARGRGSFQIFEAIRIVKCKNVLRKKYCFTHCTPAKRQKTSSSSSSSAVAPIFSSTRSINRSMAVAMASHLPQISKSDRIINLDGATRFLRRSTVKVPHLGESDGDGGDLFGKKTIHEKQNP